FPCWPKDRPARFEGIRAYGAFLISAELAGGVIRSARIASEKGCPCTILNPWPGEAAQVVRNGVKREVVSGDQFTMVTAPGECIELTKVSPRKV
ncbi:MAG: trehalose hydrolase, partial [bacterium]